MRKYADNICIGLEHFIDKIGYQSSIYNENGETIKYLINDVSGRSRLFADKYSADVVILPNNSLLRILVCILCFFRYKSKYVELYCTGRSAFIYGILSKLFARRLVVILRGTEFSNGKQLLISNLFVLKIADVIIAKEYNLVESLKKYSLDHKSFFLHNAIPKLGIARNYKERSIDVLFLNTPRYSRNVLFLIDVFYELLKMKPNLNIVLAGFSILDRMQNNIEEEYQKKVLNRIDVLGLRNTIKVLGFVDNPSSLLTDCKVFVFPANIIFCNYTLLEAMSVGAVPVVLNGEGANLIVDDKIDGRINKLSVDEFVQSIVECLETSIWINYSISAQNKILLKFSIKNWYEKLSKFKLGLSDVE